VNSGMAVYSFCPSDEKALRFGDYANGIHCCQSISELVKIMTEEKRRNYAHAH
jgi:hypothetical protein